MTIKEQILMESIGYKGQNFSENYYFSQLSKGFVKDYKKFGDKTIQMYEDFFGDEYAPIFESMAENIEVLSEAAEKDGMLLFELDGTGGSQYYMRDYYAKENAKNGDSLWNRGVGNAKKARHYLGLNSVDHETQRLKNYSSNRAAEKEAAEAASETAREAMRATGAGTGAVPKGFLANVWNSIKSWGKGLMEKFPGLGKFLKNGVSWVTDPANAWKIAAGAGAAALGAIALRIRNKKKREAFLAASKQKPV